MTVSRWLRVGMVLGAVIVPPVHAAEDRRWRAEAEEGRLRQIAETQPDRSSGSASTEESGEADGQARQDRRAHADGSDGPGWLTDEVRRLKRLQREDPEEFRRVVQEKKAQLRRRIGQLQQTDPAAYEAVMARLRQRRARRLARLEAQDPDEFRQHLQRQRERMERRVGELQQSDPERYARLLEQRRQWRKQSLEELRQNNPARYERFLQAHPGWAEGMDRSDGSGAGAHPPSHDDRRQQGGRPGGRIDRRSEPESPGPSRPASQKREPMIEGAGRRAPRRGP
ncbi:MAG: hypothetical protein HYZ92_06515 [Candidatus Omnitrophica bacterium]|nr:hypothetical protein [Candidatus Omnitrophota bacterium]